MKFINPAEDIEFLPWSKDKDWPNRRGIVAKRYKKPEMHGSLYLPEAFLEDTTGTLWEVVKASARAEDILALERGALRQGTILKVRGHDFPLGLEVHDEADMEHLVMIDAEAVYQVWFVD